MSSAYEPGRTHLAVYNWDGLPSVTVDLSAYGYQMGDAFEIRDAQDYFGSPVASGMFDGNAVMLPMSGLSKADPVGTPAPPHSGPEFAAFVISGSPSGSGAGGGSTAQSSSASGVGGGSASTSGAGGGGGGATSGGAEPGDEGGCACRLAGGSGAPIEGLVVVLAAAATLAIRRRKGHGS